MPKFNLYQSLHTTVVGPQGRAVEFQIRTLEMHRRAEFGVAAHWGYKEQRNPTEDLVWLQRIVDWQQETTDPAEFMQSLKIDLEQDEVFVFTPKGKVITLPTDADAGRLRVRDPHRGRAPLYRCACERPLDPARRHAAVGRHVRDLHEQGRGRGPEPRLVAVRADPARPLEDPPVVLARAPRRRDRQRPRRAREGDAARGAAGAEALGFAGAHARRRAAQLRRPRRACTPVSARATSRRKAVVQRIQRELRGGEEQLPTTVARPPRFRGRRRAGAGVHVEGLDDVMVRLSRCCTPVPGDEIMGFVTRGRGVSVHRTDCANAVSLRDQADRVIDVEWDNDSPGNYTVSVEVEALDRSKLLRDVADVLSEHHVNIISCTSQTQVRPDRPPPVRVRARRSRPSRFDPGRGEARRTRCTTPPASCPAPASDGTVRSARASKPTAHRSGTGAVALRAQAM